MQIQLFKELLGRIFSRILKPVHLPLHPCLRARASKLHLKPVLHVFCKDERILFEIVTAQILQKSLLGHLRPLPCILPYFAFFEQEQGWELQSALATLKELTYASLELAVSHGDLILPCSHICQLDKLSLNG